MPEGAGASERWVPRLARGDDVPAIGELIGLSARAFLADVYGAEETEAAIGPVFGVDRQLVRDETYLVVEERGALVGCGGWSRRRSLFGGDSGRSGPDPELDPERDPARVRAFFVHPQWSRRGVASSILRASEAAMARAGFTRSVAVATAAGEPLYRAFNYRVTGRIWIPLRGSLRIPAAEMAKELSGTVQPAQEPGAE